MSLHHHRLAAVPPNPCVVDLTDAASIASSPSAADTELDDPECDVAELFSPPRVCARAVNYGLVGGFSHDLKTGVDLNSFDGRALTWAALRSASPRVLVASPPCTWFTRIQFLNARHYTTDIVAVREATAMSLLDFAVRCCSEQFNHNRGFIFEHPWQATSWQISPTLRALANLPTVAAVDFDQCRTGLVGPNGQPIKKRTRFLTNMPQVVTCFAQLQCNCKEKHLNLMGACNGIQLSSYCQVYTPMLCDTILECVRAYVA